MEDGKQNSPHLLSSLPHFPHPLTILPHSRRSWIRVLESMGKLQI